jgi:uncharacterized small protein (DUF1192 family)
MTDQPDNLEPWQRVAAELGTWEMCDGTMQDWGDRGRYVDVWAACREIARLRTELQDRLDSQQTLEIAQLRAEVERLRAQVRPAAAAPELPAPAAGKPPAG